MPILGIVDSSKRVSSDTGAMFPLQVVTVGASGASSVTFSNIPSTYAYLQIRGIARTNRTSPITDPLTARFNSDSGTNYTLHSLYSGGGGTVATSAATGYDRYYFYQATTAASASNMFGTFIVDILDYANTNKYKTIRALGATDQNNASNGQAIRFSSGLWLSTNAINTITFAQAGGTAFNEYSQFALYGVKSA